MSRELELVRIDTDVLVIGGGLAGCMAAIKAREHGVDVVLAEKANTENSGGAGTGIDHFWAYIPPVHGAMGWTLDDMLEDHVKGYASGLINRDLLELVASQTYNRAMDLERFGVNFRFKDSPLPGNFRVVFQYHSVPSSFNFDGREIKRKQTLQAKRRGVKIFNRVMMTDLVTNDGQIAGALGIGVRDGKLYFFRAKAVVLSTGRSSRWTRPPSGLRHNLRIPAEDTGDGKAMALRAGVGVINMEFVSSPGFSISGNEINLGSPRSTTQPAGSITGPNGEVFIPRTHFYDWSKLGKEEVDAAAVRRGWMAARAGGAGRPASRLDYPGLRRQGKGPFFLDLTAGTEEEIKYIEWSIANEGKGFYWLHHVKDEERFDFRRDKLEYLPNARELSQLGAAGTVVDKNLETQIKGLFAAGDDVGGLPGSASPGAVTMGWHAGDMAGARASKQPALVPATDQQAEPLRERCSKLLAAEDGFHWSELELAVQNAFDYYCGDERTAAYLERGLLRLRELKETTPLKAESPHELGRCLEVRSIVENAEMIVRASLARRETRRAPARFARADYPEQDDENFLCFLSQRQTNGQVEFSKIPVG
ncbi:MAG: FAD-binding protein [Chloroflexota bacterium]|nr:FAD-binding protein [Chloroflexota bacterium]